MSRFLGGARQVGFVVHDIEAAMAHWHRVLGVGPWFYKEDVGTTEFSYYGKLSAIPRLSIALANSGDLQIELIQQRNDAPSLYLDSLRRSGEGAQHIAWWTEDRFDILARQLLDAGYVEGHAGRMGQRGRFAYYLHPDLPSGMVELSETSGGKGEYFQKIAAASRDWDGREPVRVMSAAPAAGAS
ncbi:VOC family protein [Xylophilus rhododendri]|uniref:VOC family protein n=1 Tax=Xylophilus rhododendri TaxID=2697032 RepID=A0A857JA19_9BURK|nr:VOC family protein [Xylophilus rhododendri]QHJ00578.1 VOC family protein [Xylophilus rhododendri]